MTTSIRETLTEEAKKTETPSSTAPDPEKTSTPETKPDSNKPDPKVAPEGLKEHDKQLLRKGGLSEEKFNALPPEIQKATIQAYRAYDKGFHSDRQEVARAIRLQETFETNPGLEDDVLEVIEKRIKGGPTTAKETKIVAKASPETAKVLKGFDRLLEETTDPADRERIRETKQVVLEEFSEQLNAAIGELREEMKGLKSTTHQGRRADATTEIDGLEAEFPSSLIEKYRKGLIDFKVRYPQLTAKQILYKVADPDEIEAVRKPAPSTPKPNPPPNAPVVSGKAETTITAEEEQNFRHKGKKTGGWKLDALLRHVLKKDKVLE